MTPNLSAPIETMFTPTELEDMYKEFGYGTTRGRIVFSNIIDDATADVKLDAEQLLIFMKTIQQFTEHTIKELESDHATN